MCRLRAAHAGHTGPCFNRRAGLRRVVSFRLLWFLPGLYGANLGQWGCRMESYDGILARPHSSCGNSVPSLLLVEFRARAQASQVRRTSVIAWDESSYDLDRPGDPREKSPPDCFVAERRPRGIVIRF